MNKIIKQILIISVFSVIVGFLVNWVNPKGIPLVMDMSKYSTEQSDKLKEEFLNNPYDTTENVKSMIKNPRLNSQGFVDPQNIKLDFAKVLYHKKALFIDARTPEEYAQGRVKGAVNIPYEVFHRKTKEEQAEMMKGYNKNGIIVCYCKGGDCEISIDLAYDIARLGFNSINIYLGGYGEWENSGYPVEK